MISIKNKKSLLLIRNLPTSSFTQFSAQNAENGRLGLPKVSKFWGGAHPQTPPRRRELKATFWKSRLLYSDQLAASVFIETPETV